jgi:hypothetical protein
MTASLTRASKPEPSEQPVHFACTDWREAGQLRYLNLLQSHKFREPVA